MAKLIFKNLFVVKEKIEALNEQLEKEPCNIVLEKPELVDSTDHPSVKTKAKRESITGLIFYLFIFGDVTCYGSYALEKLEKVLGKRIFIFKE